LIHRRLGRTPCEGVWTAWNKDLFVVNDIQGKWLACGDYYETMRKPHVLAEIGIPVCYSLEGATVTAFSGKTPMSFSKEQLREIFGRGVLLDGAALGSLEKMGLSGWCGVKIAGTFSRDMQKEFTRHPLNGDFSGVRRDCCQSFWEETVYALAPVKEAVSVLSELFDYGDKKHGTCMSAYENDLGGRVVVAGYYPWNLIHTMSKVEQMRSICKWSSFDTQSAVVETYAKVVVWVRKNRKGERVFILLNASLGPVPLLQVRVMGTARGYRALALGENKKKTSRRKRYGDRNITGYALKT